MTDEFGQEIVIRLEGDWSLDGIGGQFQLLSGWLRQLSVPSTPRLPPVLDLSGIRALDACGCQLLTMFVLYLRKLGIIPVLNGMDADIGTRFRQLGYDPETDPQHGLSRETP